MKRNTFKNWEKALLIALSITLLTGTWAGAQQKQLSDKVIRLHVIGASDSKGDQEIKLKVRDRILEIVTPAMEAASGRQQAQEILTGYLPELEKAASKVGQENGVALTASASLDIEAYPTREYETFSLPPGDYISLRVILDEGQGQNWWCVVFPPLCMSAAGEKLAPAADLDNSDISLITESDGYVLKFKLVELWGDIRERILGRGGQGVVSHGDDISIDDDKEYSVQDLDELDFSQFITYEGFNELGITDSYPAWMLEAVTDAQISAE